MTKNAELHAIAVLKTVSTENLIKQFEDTEKMKYSFEISIARGWIMDELERRNPIAFDKWLDLDYPDNESLKKLYLNA